MYRCCHYIKYYTAIFPVNTLNFKLCLIFKFFSHISF